MSTAIELRKQWAHCFFTGQVSISFLPSKVLISLCALSTISNRQDLYSMIHSPIQQIFIMLFKNKEKRQIKSVSLSVLPCPILVFWDHVLFLGERTLWKKIVCHYQRDPIATENLTLTHLASPMLIHASHGDIKGSSLRMKDKYLKVTCGKMANWAYTPVLATQKQNMTNDSRIGPGISQKGREYGIEDNRWEINMEEVTSHAGGGGRMMYEQLAPLTETLGAPHWEDPASYRKGVMLQAERKLILYSTVRFSVFLLRPSWPLQELAGLFSEEIVTMSLRLGTSGKGEV